MPSKRHYNRKVNSCQEIGRGDRRRHRRSSGHRRDLRTTSRQRRSDGRACRYSLEGIEKNAEALSTEGYRATSVATDIADPAACAALIDGTVEREGRIDILVNNAAVYQGIRTTPAEEISIEDWRRIVDVNVSGMYYMCRAVIPHLKAQRSGVIINQTSGSIWTCPPGMLHYVTTKSTAIPMTKILALNSVPSAYGSMPSPPGSPIRPRPTMWPSNGPST